MTPDTQGVKPKIRGRYGRTIFAFQNGRLRERIIRGHQKAPHQQTRRRKG